jgi:hypothetical protein
VSSNTELRRVLENIFPNATGEEIDVLCELHVLATLSIEEETD